MEGALGLWVLFEDMTTETIGIIGSRQGDGVIIIGGTYDRECLGHQPGRLVGIFHRELRLGGISWYELRQIDGGDTRMMLGDRHGEGDMLSSRQDGQVMLFTIGEVCSTDSHLTDEK